MYTTFLCRLMVSRFQLLSKSTAADLSPEPALQYSYWNYGAASAKWVPPENRARGRNGAAVPLHLAVKDACYTWDETAAAVRC
jgi:hypothetical protein